MQENVWVAKAESPRREDGARLKGPWDGFEVKGKLATLVGGGVFPEAHHNGGAPIGSSGGGTRYPVQIRSEILKSSKDTAKPTAVRRPRLKS